MLKKAVLLLSAISCFALHSDAQKCGTDEVNNALKEKYPQIAINEELLNQEITNRLSRGQFTHLMKSTEGEADTFDIPIVVHIVHDYGAEYVSDNTIFNAVVEWNKTFNKRYADTSQVLPQFRIYIGNARINLRLATRDPYGNPTKGITRHQSQLTTNAGDFAKYDGWPNDSYVNIWLIRGFSDEHSTAAAYAYKPAAGQQLPWHDGIISQASSFNQDRTIEHEMAHVFNIDHVWGGTNQPEVACGDDNVDDTPPTKGHSPDGGCGELTDIYDTTCSRGYVKVYPSIVPGIDSLVDYPDTNNSQNIMDYTYCSLMFSIGQVERMHAALNTNTAGRNNLWKSTNLVATGALQPRQDIAPVADFYVGNGYQGFSERTFFTCANTNDSFVFNNASWGDTITTVDWQFTNGAAKPTATTNAAAGAQFIRNQFSQPGWVTVTATANSNAGSSSISKQVYAADNSVKINPLSNGFYYQEFTPGGDLDKWPTFNYYNNQWKWQLSNTGYYDNHSIMYTGFESRGYPEIFIDNPEGDYDDLYSPAFDLSGFPANSDCNINYMYAATALSAFLTDLTDELEISYSINCGKTWVDMTAGGLSADKLVNNGNYTSWYQPQWMGEWDLMSINIPNAARVNGVYFRFRYKPGVNANNNPTGNNFYMDRINISNFPLGANTMITEERKVVLAPNPTQAGSTVIISGDMNADASVMVTDITGKLVYKTQQKLNSQYTVIDIPASALAVKGMDMVQVVTNNQSHTEKLVVY